jgi:hypothetical protein
VKKDRRKSFNFIFWTVPFDGWGWALMGLSMLGFTLVLKGNWLDVLGALFLRQSCSSANRNKVLILLLLAAIVLTCVYESFISGHVIVPPPVLVARNLKELVQLNYQLFGWGNNTANRSIIKIMIQEKISYSSQGEPPFSPDSRDLPSLSVTERYELWSGCNLTSVVSPELGIDIYQEQMDWFRPGLGIQCHFVEETKIPNENVFSYSGYSVPTFHGMVTSFQESGLLDMLARLQVFAWSYKVKVRAERRKYRDEKAEVPFELKDPKILSIFIGTGVLLAGASLVFLTEVCKSSIIWFYNNRLRWYTYTDSVVILDIKNK